MLCKSDTLEIPVNLREFAPQRETLFLKRSTKVSFHGAVYVPLIGGSALDETAGKETSRTHLPSKGIP